MRERAEALRSSGEYFLAAHAYQQAERLAGTDHDARAQRFVMLHHAGLITQAVHTLEEGLEFGFPVNYILKLLRMYSSVRIGQKFANRIAASAPRGENLDILRAAAETEFVNIPIAVLSNGPSPQKSRDYSYENMIIDIQSRTSNRRYFFDIAAREGLLHFYDHRIGLCPREEGANHPKVFAYWNSPHLPTEVAQATSTWKDVASEVAIYNEETAADLLCANFGSTGIEAFKACYHPAMHSDLFRLAALVSYGGLYIDADEERTGRVSDLTDVCEAMGAKRLFVVDDYGEKCIITNKSIYCVKGDAMISFIANKILERVNSLNGKRTDIGFVTGPHAVTEYAVDYLAANPKEIMATAFVGLTAFNRIFRSRPMYYKRTASGNWRNAAAQESTETPSAVGFLQTG